MIITHETTIEQYEAWLATNPSFSSFKVAVRSTFRSIYATIGRIRRLVRKVKTRSCLAPKTQPPVYPDAWKFLFQTWRLTISKELNRTERHIYRLELFDRISEQKWGEALYKDRHRRIAEKIEQELAMELLKCEALQILSK